MSRKTLVTIHLYLATFLSPIILMMAISGGLYLFGLKGNVVETSIYSGPSREVNLSSSNPKQEVKRMLSSIGVDHDFEYIKGNKKIAITRPTSRDYYVLRIQGEELTITKEEPDLIKTIVELHKGHGPTSFKWLQKITAFGLCFILLSGLWLALKSPGLRKNSLIISGLGLVLFIVLAA